MKISVLTQIYATANNFGTLTQALVKDEEAPDVAEDVVQPITFTLRRKRNKNF